MKLIRTTAALFTASIGAALLAAPASAVPLPIASLGYNGTLNLNASEGLTITGDFNAQYRTPPGAAGPYQFDTSLNLGPITASPEFTVTTPEIVLVPGGETCIGSFCFPIPPVTLPPQIVPLNPTLTLADEINVYDLSYTSGNLPLGDIFAFDFGTALLGDALNLDSLVQDQFETGATAVNETGVVFGPFTSDYAYEGILQPDGETILGSYQVDISGPGILADLETALLDLINDNTALLSDFALQGLIASNPCGVLGPIQDICNSIISGLDSSQLLVTVASLGDFSAGYSVDKSITPLGNNPDPDPNAVPTPATLPLLAAGLLMLGMGSRRRRQA
ncbi:MAG: PEP-CTERM sorting domain-containing protein [Pseudomonadales bacterium]